MDLLFIAASGLLTTYLPRQCLAWTSINATTPMPPVSNGNTTTNHQSSNNTNNNNNNSLTTDDKKHDVSLSSYSLFGTSTGNKQSISNNTPYSMLFTISLGLSLLLFSLNILELFPQSWLLWIVMSNETATVIPTTISITNLYRILLWMITIHCMIIIPSSVGIAMMMMTIYDHTNSRNDTDHNSTNPNSHNHSNQDDDVDDRKKRKGPPSNRRIRRHWAVRIFYYSLSTSIKIVTSTLLYYIFHPFYRTVQYYILIPALHKFRWCCHCRNSLLPTTTTTSNQHRINHLFIVRCWYDPVLRKCVLYGSLIGILVTTLLLQSIYPLVIEQQLHHSHSDSSNILLHCIKCLCAVGIVISTILNGFGSISLPYTCIAGLFVEPIPYDIIRNADMELEKIKVNLNKKIQDFIKTSNETMIPVVPLGSVSSSNSNGTAVSPPKLSSSFWVTTQKKRGVRRFLSDFTNDATSQQRQKTTTLLSEIEFLETLIDDMTNNVDEMHYTQSISSDARTTVGKLRSHMGIFFSMILLSRLLSALSNVGKKYFMNSGVVSSFWRPTPTTSITTTEANIDLVTQIVLWLSGHNVATTETLHSISQCVSLFLTALLSISQMRVFLRTITTIQRRMNKFYQKCYCQSFRFGCNDYKSNHQRHHKMKLSSSFTETTIASYMSLQSNHSSNSSTDDNVPDHGSSGNDPNYNVWFLSHPISFLLCCYCLTCIVLTKMMLPSEYRTNFSNALSFLTVTNNHHHHITNTIFIIRTYTIDLLYSITALISGTILAITLSFMRSNVRRIQSYSSDNCNDSGTHRSPSFHTAPTSLNRAVDGIHNEYV